MFLFSLRLVSETARTITLTAVLLTPVTPCDQMLKIKKD